MIKQHANTNVDTKRKGAIALMMKDGRIGAEQLTGIVVDMFVASTDTASHLFVQVL